MEKVLSEDWHTARERQRWNDLFVGVMTGLVDACVAEQERHVLYEEFLQS